MKSVILKDGSEFHADQYFADNGIDITGTTGKPGFEGWLDLFKDRSDVLLTGIHRKTGREVEIDFYNHMSEYGYEVDRKASFEKQQEIIKIENEKAEREAIQKEMKRQSEEYGVDFSKIYDFLPGAEKRKKGDVIKSPEYSEELTKHLAFPFTEALEKSGKKDEKWGGWFPKKWGSYAMDVASLSVRAPVAFVEDAVYQATKGEKGVPFPVSMGQVPDYGLNDNETIQGHFESLQEAFRYDPGRVLKDLGRESVRDPLSGLALTSWLVSGGGSTPLVGGRAGTILASLGKKYKSFSKGVEGAKKVKKSVNVLNKVKDKIEKLDPVSKALVKTGIATTSEGVSGAAQGYMGKIFMGGDATFNDALVEGIEEGAFGLFMSTSLGVPRAVWDKMTGKQQSAILNDARADVQAVQEKLDNGVSLDALTQQEAELVKFTNYGKDQKVGETQENLAEVKATDTGTIVNVEGNPEMVPITSPLPETVDSNDAKKQRENSAHITKAEKLAMERERKERLENSKLIKAMAKESKLFDENLQKEIDNIVKEAVNENETEFSESEKANEENLNNIKKDFEVFSDVSKDIDFQSFSKAAGKIFQDRESVRSAYANYKIQQEHAKKFQENLKKDSTTRKANRDKLIKINKIKSDRIIVEPAQKLQVKPGEKYLHSLHKKVKEHMMSKGKNPSDEDVRAALKNGYTIPAKYKESGFVGAQKKERAYHNKIMEELLATGIGLDEAVSVKASEAPNEFTVGKQYFTKMKSKDADAVKFKDVNGKEYVFKPDDDIFTDPEFSDIVSSDVMQSFEDLDENFAMALAANDPTIQVLTESLNKKTTQDATEESSSEEELSNFEKSIAIIDADVDEEFNADSPEDVVYHDPLEAEVEEETKAHVEEVINEITPIRDSFLKKAPPTEHEAKVFSVIDKIHSERSEINNRIEKRAKLRKQAENIEIERNNVIERISRNSQKKADKIADRDNRYTEWENDGTNPIPPEKADYSKEDQVVDNAVKKLEELNEKSHAVEKELNTFEDLDQLDYDNQLAFNLFKKAKVNGFKSFKQKVMGEKPKKYEKNVSSKKWDARIKEINDWELKNNLIDQMMASSFPGIYLNHPDLADMVASQAWKNSIPNSLVDAKNKAKMFVDGQRGAISTSLLIKAAKYAALSAYTGGPFTGAAAYAGLHIALKMHKRFFRSSPGKFMLHSVRAQLLQIPSFKRIVPRIDQAFLLKNRINSNYQIRYEKATKGLKPEEMEQIRPYIEGRLSPDNVSDKVVIAAESVRGFFFEWAERLNSTGLEIKPDKNYFPRVYDPDVFLNMDKAQTEEVIQHLMKNDPKITRADAAAIIKSVYDYCNEGNEYKSKTRDKEFYENLLAKSIESVGVNYVRVTKDFNRKVANIKARIGEKVSGNIAFKRVLPDMPNFVYKSDINSIIKDYFNGATNFVVHRQKFGNGLQLINDALFAQFADKKSGGLTKEGERFKKYIEAELFNKSLILDFWGKPITSKAVEPLTRYQFYSKLMTSLLAPVRNMVTAANVSNSIHGFSATAIGLLKLFGDTVKGEPFRHAHLAGVITDASMKDVLGQALFTPNRMESMVSKFHPFPISENIVRTVAYNGAMVYAKRLFAKANKGDLKAREQLTYYLGEKRVLSDLAQGTMSRESLELMGAQGASDVAGHARVMNLPPFLNTPEGKLVFQYRRIAFHNTVVLKDKVFAPAAKRNVMPLLRWGLSVGLTIPAVATLAAMIYGERDNEEEMSSYGAEAWSLMKSINTVNSLGLFGDFAASYEQGTGWGIAPVVGSFTGPTVSTVLNLASDLISAGKTPERTEELAKRTMKREFPGLFQGAQMTGIDFFEEK